MLPALLPLYLLVLMRAVVDLPWCYAGYYKVHRTEEAHQSHEEAGCRDATGGGAWWWRRQEMIRQPRQQCNPFTAEAPIVRQNTKVIQ